MVEYYATDIGLDYIRANSDDPTVLFGRECMAFDAATDYAQWEFACQEVTQAMTTTLVYECYADGGCPADDTNTAGIFYWDTTSNDSETSPYEPVWLTRSGWHLTREVGKIVDSYTELTAWEYVDYMFCQTGDLVFVGTTDSATVYECMDGDLCSSFSPEEWADGTAWKVVDGKLTTTAEVEATEYVEALPLWMLELYADYISFDSGDYFQLRGNVYQCCDP
jgi:hypothetical protein